MKICIVAFDDFTDLDIFLPWDVLNRVRLVGGHSDWNVKIVGTSDTHVSMAGLRIPTTGTLEEIRDAEAVIFGSGKGVQPLIRDEAYLDQLRSVLRPEVQVIGSMCSGALILAAVGLLQGKKATTYPTARTQLAAYGVEVVNESMVLQGKLATAAGCLAAEELSEWVIKELVGQEMADQVLRSVQPVGKGL